MEEIPIVFLGHKDHGKSTLIGRLILDSNSIKESRVQEIMDADKSAGRQFELAHLLDSFREEREREMTMDTTRAILRGKRNYQLIDVPGHSELISSMLTGTSAAEAAILVVSIEEGIMEQTIEHLKLAKLLKINQLAVAISKLDKKNYNREAFEEQVSNLKKILKIIGYDSQEINFFPISALLGDNIFLKSENTPWYQGKSLIDYIETEVEGPEKLADYYLRFIVQDFYPEGEIVIGKIESGKLRPGDEIIFMPSAKTAKIKKIYLSEEVDFAEAGDNAGLVFENRPDVSRGELAIRAGETITVAKEISGEVFWIKEPTTRELVVECGAFRTTGSLSLESKPEAGEKTAYKISLKKEIAFDDKMRGQLSAIAFKDLGSLIAVGNVFKT